MQRMTTVVGRVGVVGQGVVTRGKNRNTSLSRITTRSTRFLSSNPWNVSLWPVSQKTSLYNICPKGQVMIIERMGKLHKIQNEGFFFAIPFVDNIRYCIDMRERTLSVPPFSCFTKDNVPVDVDGDIYCHFIDPELAAYGVEDPLHSAQKMAESSMRTVIGDYELEDLLHDRQEINERLRESVQEAAKSWGLEILRCEVNHVNPADSILEAMNEKVFNDLQNKKQALETAWLKRKAELEAETKKIRIVTDSESELIRVRNEALAQKERIILEAEAQATSILQKAEAHSKAIQEIALAIGKDTNSQQAAQLNLAREYIAMYSDIGQKSNTMIFSDRPGDVNALMNQADAVLNSFKK